MERRYQSRVNVLRRIWVGHRLQHLSLPGSPLKDIRTDSGLTHASLLISACEVIRLCLGTFGSILSLESI